MKRKAITPREMEAAYNRCLQRERDRERKAKLTKQGAFEASVVHFDMEHEECRERQNSVSWLTDHGKGARQIRRAADLGSKPTRHQLLNRAQMRLSRHLPECLETFWLVIKNETNWKESVWQIMKSMLKEHPNGKRQKGSTIHSSKKS